MGKKQIQAMHSNIDSLTTGQGRTKGLLSAKFTQKMHGKKLFFVISVLNIAI